MSSHRAPEPRAGLDVDATDGDWSVADLDRCEHGRHSLDACDGCPGGKSTGNLYLLNMGVAPLAVSIDEANGVQTVRIGTTYDRRPIRMRPDRRPRW